MALNKGYLTAKTNDASDEQYTPAYAVEPLYKYLDKYHNDSNFTIWCPFDTEDSEYVKGFLQRGFTVIATHIDNGENFFYFEPEEHYDIIISNPPFSIKDDILRRLYELGKPFAILLPIPTLQGQKRYPYLVGCQALIFDKRINFYKDAEKTQIQKGASFASFYLCKDFLPRDLIFEELEVK